MATKLQHKRSSTVGSIPTVNDLALGEIAVNTAEGHLYIKVDDGTVERIVRIAGSELQAQSAITIDTFNGDGSTQTFTLTRAPDDEHYVFVTINGVAQHVDAYALSNTSLIFNAAPQTGDVIEARIFNTQTNSLQLRDYKSYVYSISGSTSTISGNDDYGASLEYDVGKVEVFYNGVKLVPSYDYTATSGTSIALLSPVEAGTIEVVSLAKAAFANLDAYFTTVNKDLSTTSEQTADSFRTSDFRVVKYIVTLTNGTDYHCSEVLVMHDDTNTYITEYGTMYTNASLGTISADIASGYVRLRVTPANATTTTFNCQRLSVTV